MTYRRFFLMLCWLTAAISSFANDNQRDAILSQITGARIPEYVINIQKMGAKGNGTTDCLPAFKKAFKKAVRRGGARVVVPAGVYYIKGPLHLVSNVCLEIQEGATLKFAPEPEYYLPAVKTSWEGTFLQNYSPFIYGYQLHDVSIIGKGTIDGNAMTTFATWRSLQKPAQQRSRVMNHAGTPVSERNFGEGDYLRPHLIQLYGCERITIEDVFITNSPFWCIHLLQSENAILRGIRFDAKLVNNDGIDPEMSRNVLIEDVHFNNGDDNVAIKSGRDHDGRGAACPSENIIIRNCHFKGLHAVVLGSEMSAGIQNVYVENCDYAGYCKRGLYIKTNPDRGGFIRNISFRNCEFDEVEDLFYITSMYGGEGQDNTFFTDIENITVENIQCRKARAGGLVLQGTKAKPLRNIQFRNITIGEVKNAISFDDTEDVVLKDCHFGGKAGVPTTVSEKDNIFK